MPVTSPPDLRPIEPLASRPARRRRLLQWMLVGSVLLHLLLLAGFYLLRPETPPDPGPTNSDEVAMVFESQAGSQQASTPSPTPSEPANVAAGNPLAPETTPAQDTSLPAPPPPPPTQTPPTPTPPTAQEVPPTPEAPPPPTPAPPSPTQPPPTPQPPPTVSLSQEEPDLPPPPAFQMPQPPPPLPPLPPRPAPPRAVARAAPRNPFAFPTPQDWSFNTAPTQQAPGRASRGFDLSTTPQGGQNSQSLNYVSGAKPSGDWMSALRKWIEARVYYPEQAIANGEDGQATVVVEFDRSGRVLSVRLVSTSHSQFLDGAWLDVFRRATVPPFTPDMTEQTTTLTGTLRYRLIRR